MRLRTFVLIFIAIALAGLGTWPATAQAGCPPTCSVAGTVVGSVITPPYNITLHGTLTDYSGAQYQFKVEGPYTKGVSGAYAVGTVKIVGPGAPNGQNKLWAAVRFDGSPSNLRMSNINSFDSITASGDFTITGGAFTSPNVSVTNEPAPTYT